MEPALFSAGPARWASLPAWKAATRPSRPRTSPKARGIDIVIPVYQGYDESLACIDAVLATVRGAATVVVVDDATPDPALAAALETRAAKGRIILLRNSENLGFVRSVNRAFARDDAPTSCC